MTLEQSFQCPNQNMWINTIKMEMDGIFCNKTFKNNSLPEKQQPIIAKFVFDVKYKEEETVLKYKAYLVAKNFVQIYKIDYKKTFALTIKYKTFWLLYAVIAKLDWQIYQIDIVIIFLAGKLHERIW